MVKLEMKALFFDRAAVIAMMDRATHAALKAAGAAVRTVARQSIRRRKKPSPPGHAPSAHAKEGLKKIIFAFDRGRSSVVIGPVGFGNNAGQVPNVQEFGGESEIKQHKWSAPARGEKPAVRVQRPAKGAKARVEARPFMGPALSREIPKLPSRWSASVRSS